MRFPFVTLDVGGTLIGPRTSFGAVYAEVLAGLGVHRSAEAFERSIRLAMAEMERLVTPGEDRYRVFPGGEVGYWMHFARLAVHRAVHGVAAPVLEPVPAGGPPQGDSVAERAVRVLRDHFRRADSWQIYPDVLPALDALRERGTQLAVVSNWDSLLPDLLEGLDLARYMDVTVVSHLEAVEKPDPEI